MSAIGDFVNAIQRIATAAGLLPGRKIVRVLEPLSAVDNPDTGTTDLSVTAGAGGNAYSTTTASFVQPAKGDNVQISVDSTGWFVPFPAVFMDGVGLYTIVSKDSPTLATLQLQFDLAESGSTVTAGKLVVPTGFPGNDGASAYGSTDSFFIQPAVGSTVTTRTHNSPWAGIGQVLFLSGATSGGYYKVTAKGSEPGGEPTLDLINLGYPGNAAPGDNVTYSQTISPAGPTGPTGATGPTGPIGATGPAGRGYQAGAVTLVDGLATVTGVTITATSRIMLNPSTDGYGGDTFTRVDARRRTVGASGSGSFDIVTLDGAYDETGAGTPVVEWVILEQADSTPPGGWNLRFESAPGTVTLAIGDLLIYDSAVNQPDIILPAITSGNAGMCVGLYVHGDETPIVAATHPNTIASGEVDSGWQQFRLGTLMVLMSDGTSNWMPWGAVQ